MIIGSPMTCGWSIVCVSSSVAGPVASRRCPRHFMICVGGHMEILNNFDLRRLPRDGHAWPV
eukprot:852069-Pyramimonas_sp.AAC.1